MPIMSEPNARLIVFGANVDLQFTVLLHSTNRDGAAAHVAVLDVLLHLRRVLNQQLDRFTAVRTLHPHAWNH